MVERTLEMTRLVWRVFVALLGLVALFGTGWFAIKGFHGTLGSFGAGFGWVFAAFYMFWTVAEDILKAIGAVVERIDSPQ